MTQDSIGQAIGSARKLRGLTQQGLADRASCSVSLVRKVERGDRDATPSFISAVSRALHVDVTELTGQPYRGQTANEDAIHEPIAELRREVAVYDLPPESYERPPPRLAELRPRVGEITRLRQAARYLKLGAELPALLCDLRAAAHASPASEQDRIFGLLAESYDACRTLAYKLGYLDLAALLVTRHAYAAERSGDPLELAVGETMRAHEMIGAGEFRSAEALMNASLTRIGDAVNDDEPATISVFGYLHLEASLAAARGGDGDTADDHLAEASEAAERLGADRDDYRLVFGPVNVRIWDVSMAVELGDAGAAIARSDSGAFEPPTGFPAERTSHYYIDLARCYLWTGRPADRDRSLQHLLKAERIAPQHTRFHPMTRETVRQLTRLSRTSPDSLIGLAARVGVRS
jgi:transcriptional regulator with XRE-family HTH domain